MCIYDKGLIYGKYKELSKINNKKTTLLKRFIKEDM